MNNCEYNVIVEFVEDINLPVDMGNWRGDILYPKGYRVLANVLDREPKTSSIRFTEGNWLYDIPNEVIKVVENKD